MPLNVQRKVGLAFALAIAVVAVISAAAFLGLRSMETSTASARASSEQLAALDAIVQAVTEAESAQRGYLLTDDVRQRNRFHLSRAALTRHALVLRAVTPSALRTTIDETIALAERRVAALETGLAARERQGTEAAMAAVRVPRGREMMDSLRIRVADLRGRELAALAENDSDARAAVNRLKLVVFLGLLVVAAIAAMAVILVHRNERTNVRARRELERTRDAAEAASRAKSDFLARMSHELRTPLNAVIGFAGVLMRNRRGALDDRDMSYLERIQTSGNNLLDIINDILDLSKVESGRMDLTLESVDVGVLLQQTAASFSELVLNREVVLATDVHPGLVPVRTDPARLRQVLGNLISNALKFTESGRVLVRLVPDPARMRAWRIDVIDSGIGVASSRRAAIFGAFEQGENTITRRFGGTGLGLAISRSMCERLGFSLSVTSEDGVGSTFTILLDTAARPPAMHLPPMGGEPVTRPTPSASLPAVKAAVDGTRPLVLIIDDSADSRLLLSQYVDDMGYLSIAAVNGEQGLQMALEFHPDVILQDLQMPGMDGWEVIQRLKAHRSTAAIPVIVVSIVANENPAGLLGVVDVIAKPVDRDVLHAAIRANLEVPEGRVLVVDDSEEIARLIQAQLEEFPGITVEIAENGRVALERLPTFVPDLIILDLMMPEMDGFAFLNSIRANLDTALIPVVVATGRELSPRERQVLELQTIGVLHKGMASGEELRRTLRRALQKIRSERAAVVTE